MFELFQGKIAQSMIMREDNSERAQYIFCPKDKLSSDACE